MVDTALDAKMQGKAQAAAARVHGDRASGFLALGTIVAALIAMPIVALFVIALSGGYEGWQHLFMTVVPSATLTTFKLLVFVALLTTVVGVALAWLVVTFEFPGRRLFSWALILPLSVPTYLAAYAYGEFLHFTGPVQEAIRAVFGFQSSRDYWFPDVRSTTGAALVLSSVLYPYVYLTTRTLFVMQGCSAADVARTLGVRALPVFFRVQLPMARPAIVIGVALALMETLNDIGAVAYLGVRTLTFTIFDTWLNRGNLAGAAQIACLMLIIVLGLVFAERMARGRQRYANTRSSSAHQKAALQVLKGGWRWVASLACLLTILAGFGIPALVLGGFALARLDQFADGRLTSALLTSLGVSSCVALLTVLLAFLLTYAARVTHAPAFRLLKRLAALGYALPGTVLAIGVLIPLAALDNYVISLWSAGFGWKPGLILTGTGAAIVYACTVRFMTMAEGSIDSGFHKVSPHVDMAARTLGRTRFQAMMQVLAPMMRPAIFTAALLVFIDTMKELSATMLLRPFNFNTLATRVYEEASRGRVEDGAVAAMLIILAGIIPVIVLSANAVQPVRLAPRITKPG